MSDPAWLTSARLFELLAVVDGHLSDRKRRLFAVACCRRFQTRLTDPRSRQAVEVARRYADGLADEEERQAAEDAAFDAHIEMRESRLGGNPLLAWSRQAELLTHAAALAVTRGRFHAEDAADYARYALASEAGWRAEQEEELAQCALLREIVGPLPLYRPVGQAWRASADAHRLAEWVDGEEDFAALPILADALEEAGCTDALVLRHCREDDGHVRGCWVLDLVLGKA